MNFYSDPFAMNAEEFFARFRGESLTFDDIHVLQTRTIDFGVDSVDLTTNITRNIKIKSPLVASPMEDVSESALAIAVALEGFPAIIHYNMSIDEQAAQVARVKRFENGFVRDAVTLTPEDLIEKVIHIKNENGISTVPVIKDGRLCGLITKNDYSASLHKKCRVSERMIPLEGLNGQILKLSDLPADETNRLAKANDILLNGHHGVLLIIDDNGNFDSLVTRTDIDKNEAHPDSIKDRKKRLIAGAAVKTSIDETKERAAELVKAGVDFLCIDSSHGNSTHERDVIAFLKSEYPQIDVIYGNVATAVGAIRGVEWGADAIRVGKGVGSICSTSRVSLGTRSQITATYSCALAVRKYCAEKKIERIPVISDGGYATFSALGKGLLFADCIMLGSMLAGTDEAPGKTLYDSHGRKLKEYKGMGSVEAMSKGSTSRYDETMRDDVVGEGVVGSVKSKGPAGKWAQKIKKGIRKCMQSIGYKDLATMHEDVFNGTVLLERMSESAKKEAGIHNLVEYKTELPISY